MKLNKATHTIAASLAIASLALAATPCKKAVKAVIDPGGACTLHWLWGTPQCSEASVTSNGSCSGAASANVCSTGTQNAVYNHQKPGNTTDCSGGCISTGQTFTLTYTEAFDQAVKCTIIVVPD